MTPPPPPSGPRPWDRFLTAQDREVAAQAGYGARMGFGEVPVLMIVDATYAFCGDPGQTLEESQATYRNSCGANAWAAVDAMATLIATARTSGVPVVYTKPFRARPDGFNRGRWLDKNRRGREDIAPPARTYDICDALAPGPLDLVVEKEKPSAFFGTPVPGYLTDLGADTVIVCGGVTSGCIRSTVLDAFSYNYRVAVVEEGTFDRVEASHWINLFDMDLKYADVMGVAEVQSYLGATQGAWHRRARSAAQQEPGGAGSAGGEEGVHG